MAIRERSRNTLATVIGWVILAIVVWLVLRFVLRTLFWMLRGLIWVIVLGGLVVAYFALKSPPSQSPPSRR